MMAEWCWSRWCWSGWMIASSVERTKVTVEIVLSLSFVAQSPFAWEQRRRDQAVRAEIAFGKLQLSQRLASPSSTRHTSDRDGWRIQGRRFGSPCAVTRSTHDDDNSFCFFHFVRSSAIYMSPKWLRTGFQNGVVRQFKLRPWPLAFLSVTPSQHQLTTT